MISEHMLKTFLYDIRDDIKYDIKDDIIHDGKVSIPTAENALRRALSKSRSAGSSAGCSK
jgi:hypothetical protein